MGSKEIRAFLGGRKQGDKCLYVSTGGFSKDAHYEADRADGIHPPDRTRWTPDDPLALPAESLVGATSGARERRRDGQCDDGEVARGASGLAAVDGG